MTERRTDRELDAVLDRWMDEVAPDGAPARLLEETFARTMTSRQARVYPWHKVARVLPRSKSGSPWAVLIVTVLALVIVAVGLPLVAGGGRLAVQPPPQSPSPTIESPSARPSPAYAVVASPSAPDPTLVEAEASVAVDKPIGMASDGQALWVLTEDGRLVRIDPATNEVSDTVALDGAPYLYNGVSADPDGVWATRWSPGIVYRIDPVTRSITAQVETDLAKGVLVTEGAVWVAHTHDGTVSRIDPATNTVAETITVGPTGNSGPNWLASGLGSIWVEHPERGDGRSDRSGDQRGPGIDRHPDAGNCPAAGSPLETTRSGCQVAAGRRLTRIDPTSNKVTAILDVGGGSSPRIINGAAWISVDRGADPASIFRIDPATNQFDRVLSPGDGFRGGGEMVVAAGSLWIMDGASNRVLRLPLSAFAP